MNKFRLVRSLPAGAEYNMSLDREIFSRYLKDRRPVLRLYGWSGPSFTYGISQTPENIINLSACASDGIGVAARMTGGGVLFHNDEITYSFVCSKSDIGEPQGVFVSYRQICSFLVRFYESIGLKASFALQDKGFNDRCAPSELCSASFEKYDIVISGRKIGGNAQKRSREVIFQHGSIPIKIDWGFVSRYLKSLPQGISSSVTTLSDEAAVSIDRDYLTDKLIKAFGAEFRADFIEEDRTVYETCMA